MTTAAHIVPFRFESHEVRTLTIDGNPWFVAKNVCDVLGHASLTNCDTSGGRQQGRGVRVKCGIMPEKANGKIGLKLDVVPVGSAFNGWLVITSRRGTDDRS